MKLSMTMLILMSYELGRINEIKEIPPLLNGIIVGIIASIACCVIEFGY